MLMPNEKRQYYKVSKKYRDHEMQIALLQAFAADPELKYFVGAGLGAGLGALGASLGMLQTGTTEESQGQTAEKKKPWDPNWGTVGAATWLMGPVNPALAGKLIAEFQNKQAQDAQNASGGSAMGIIPMNEIMFLAGTGFAGSCMAILFLKAIFGTGGMGEVLKGIGEIVPL